MRRSLWIAEFVNFRIFIVCLSGAEGLVDAFVWRGLS